MRGGRSSPPRSPRCGNRLVQIRTGGGIDATDFRLLGALHRDPFATFDALGSELGLSASAARKRRRRLEEAGVLAGFLATPDATVFGRTAFAAGWKVEADLDDLLAVPDTVWAADSADGMVGALAYTHDPARWQAAMEERVGAAPFQAGPLEAPRLDPLGPLEWRVLRALVDDPTASLRALADATGLSPRTVGSRRAALLERRAVRVEPVIRPHDRGELLYHLNVVAPRSAWGSLREALHDATLIRVYDRSLYVLCKAATPSEQAARVHAARALEAVERADVVVNRDLRVATHRYHRWIDEALEAWRRARG